MSSQSWNKKSFKMNDVPGCKVTMTMQEASRRLNYAMRRLKTAEDEYAAVDEEASRFVQKNGINLGEEHAHQLELLKDSRTRSQERVQAAHAHFEVLIGEICYKGSHTDVLRALDSFESGYYPSSAVYEKVVCNAMIRRFMDPEGALAIVQRQVEDAQSLPTHDSLTMLIGSFASSFNLEGCREVFDILKEQGYTPTRKELVSIFNVALLRNDPDLAFQIIDEMVEARLEPPYRPIVNLSYENPIPNNVVLLAKDILIYGFSRNYFRDIQPLVLIMRGLSYSEQFEHVQDLHDKVLKDRLLPAKTSSDIWNMQQLLLCYKFANMPNEAINLFPSLRGYIQDPASLDTTHARTDMKPDLQVVMGSLWESLNQIESIDAGMLEMMYDVHYRESNVDIPYACTTLIGSSLAVKGSSVHFAHFVRYIACSSLLLANKYRRSDFLRRTLNSREIIPENVIEVVKLLDDPDFVRQMPDFLPNLLLTRLTDSTFPDDAHTVGLDLFRRIASKSGDVKQRPDFLKNILLSIAASGSDRICIEALESIHDTEALHLGSAEFKEIVQKMSPNATSIAMANVIDYANRNMGISVDHSTYHSLLDSSLASHNSDMGLYAISKIMWLHKLPSTQKMSQFLSVIVDDKVPDLYSLFQRFNMPVPTSLLVPFLDRLSKTGRMDLAEHALIQMEQASITVPKEAFIHIVQGFGKSGMVEKAQIMVEHYEECYGPAPLSLRSSLLFTLLSNERYDKARELGTLLDQRISSRGDKDAEPRPIDKKEMTALLSLIGTQSKLSETDANWIVSLAQSCGWEVARDPKLSCNSVVVFSLCRAFIALDLYEDLLSLLNLIKSDDSMFWTRVSIQHWMQRHADKSTEVGLPPSHTGIMPTHPASET